MSESVHCLECGAEFESRRSLHTHIKAHSMTLGEYYVKNFPKYDLLTGEPIPFRDYENYFSTDFRNKKNMYLWLSTVGELEKSEYCRNSFKRHMEDRTLEFAPNHLYLMTHPRLPKKEFFEDEELRGIFKTYGMKEIFKKSISECPDFENVPKDMVILQDTREQAPLRFKMESQVMKLDFGDYTANGDNYAYIYVDRKSETDFKGTMSAGFERFCRELDRVRQFESYLFIVVESDFRQIYLNNNALPHDRRTNLAYTWENMRNIISKYSDICQFVFTSSRENSSLVIPYLIVNGAGLRNVDLQFYLEKFQCLG